MVLAPGSQSDTLWVKIEKMDTSASFPKWDCSGEAEIELQEKLGDLRQNIKELNEKGPKKLAEGISTADSGRALDEQYDIESRILELAVKDREAALIRLSTEIEKELALLCNRIGFKGSPASWRKAVDALLQANMIERPSPKR
jgi:hypothetical protein